MYRSDIAQPRSCSRTPQLATAPFNFWLAARLPHGHLQAPTNPCSSAYSPARDLCSLSRAPCDRSGRSEEHTSELQSLMRNSYAVFCLKKKTTKQIKPRKHNSNYVNILKQKTMY